MILHDPKNFNREQNHSLNRTIILVLVLINAIIIKFAFLANEKTYLLLVITIPMLSASVIYNNKQKRAIQHRHAASQGPCNEESPERQ